MSEAYLVAHPEDRFSRDDAQINSEVQGCRKEYRNVKSGQRPGDLSPVSHLYLVTKKPVLRVYDQGRLKQTCSASEAS